MNLPPKQWAQATAARDDRTFRKRIAQCRDTERIRAVIRHEINRHGETRRKRIGVCNKRLKRLK